MIRALSTLVAVAVAMGGPVGADPPDDMRYRGLCGYHKDAPGNPPGAKTAYVYGVGAAYSVWLPHDPVMITRLDCTLLADGLPVGSATAGGAPVAVAPPTRVDYPVGTMLLSTCESVEIVDAHGQQRSWTECPPPARPVTVPPDEMREAEERYADPALCPTLASAYPSPVPNVTIDPDGDVSVFGFPVWRCPPYGT